MNTEDIRLFLAIHRGRSIHAAAQELFLAQSTVSRRLAGLEESLGMQLFVRSKGVGAVQLTAEGERFLPLAEQIAALDREACAIAEHGRAQHLSIAAPDSLVSYVLRDFLYHFSSCRPAWDLEVEVHDTAQIYEMLQNHAIDIGIANGEAPYPHLNSRLLFEEEFVVLRRGTPPQGQGETVHPSALLPQHEIYQFFSPEYNRWHGYWWDPQNAKLRVNMAHLAAGFLHTPEDWTILPRSAAAQLCPEDGYITQLEEAPPLRRCFFTTHKHPRPDRAGAIGEFYQELQLYINNGPLK